MFKDINGSSKSIMLDTARGIESVSFGIVNSDNSASDIYVDNLRLMKEIDYDDVNVRAISQEVML